MLAMMLVVLAITAVAIYFAERSAGATVALELQRRFQAELDALHNMQEIRQAVLIERCRMLVRKPRIHASLEDDALDLLYPNAEDELRDMMASEQPAEQSRYAMQALFYRFLDRRGAVIAPTNMNRVGELEAGEVVRLNLPIVPEQLQLGYITRHADDAANVISEVIAMPISSSETGEVIAAIVLGFKPFDFGRGDLEIKSGLWLDGKLWLASLPTSAREAVNLAVTQSLSAGASEHQFEIKIDGAPCLLFYKWLNPGSLFPPAYEVCIYPLTELAARRARLRWQIGGAGGLLLLVGLIASNFVSIQLSRPVEKLEHDSAENLEQRKRVEAVLDLTSEELQRSMRFSADASHQLKTPVTVLRAGLEELLIDEKLEPAAREEISTLVHQTLQLTSIIEDLLLLSRMDSGHLQIEFGPVNLTQLIEAWLDDLGALPDPLQLSVETDLPAALFVAGEKRYTSIILQNLLENARKYNQPEGIIRIEAHDNNEGYVLLTIQNTGRPIPPATQEHIFERFHRGVVGENVPGHGLGLNLARELVRLHHGELRLVRSDADWTEFSVKLLAEKPQDTAKMV
jgi:signal transduction histidine kinase